MTKKDRIDIIYDAIDQMAHAHKKPKPKQFGGGKWDFNEEIEIWKNDVNEKEKAFGEKPLTPLQWKIINSYINEKRKDLKLKKVI